MKKKHRITTFFTIILSLIIAGKIYDNNNKHNSIEYVSTNISYSDGDYEKPFVTYEELKSQKWYALQIEDETDPEKTDIIITKFTTLDEYPKGLTCYYYTNVFSEDNIVYRVFYNEEEEAFSVETGPNIKYAVSLRDYVDQYGLNNSSYTEEQITAIKNVILEKIEKGEEINKKDDVLIYERHHY